jgi:hypothetical protein
MPNVLVLTMKDWLLLRNGSSDNYVRYTDNEDRLIKICETKRSLGKNTVLPCHRARRCKMCGEWQRTMGTRFLARINFVTQATGCLALPKKFPHHSLRGSFLFWSARFDSFTLNELLADVTWLLHNTPESNRHDEPKPKRGKTQQSAGISFTGWAWYCIHRLPLKGPDHQQRVLHGVIEAFK